jgi:hypothetical protein
VVVHTYGSNIVPVRFQVLNCGKCEIASFSDIAPCSFVEVDRRFRGAYCLHRQDSYVPEGYYKIVHGA